MIRTVIQLLLYLPGEERDGWEDGRTSEITGEDIAAGPNHLLHLVDLLEEEITTCESQLKDELDQRKKYKVCEADRHTARRGHRYSCRILVAHSLFLLLHHPLINHIILFFHLPLSAFQVDDSRRTHNYDQFIITFLAMLAEQGKMSDLVKEQLQPSRKRPPPAPSTPRGPK